MAIVCARTGAAHKAKLADFGTYERARQETTQFIIVVVEGMWVRKLQYMEPLYTDIAPKALLAHFQAGCTGCHALDLLDLHSEMQRYHL